MKRLSFLIIVLLLVLTNAKAQTTAMQFKGMDCNGNSVDLFADLDAGKVVILHFFMPNCGSCPPPAKKIQTMANRINKKYPGMVKGYAFPFENSTTCSYASSWVSSNGLSALYTPMDSGEDHVAHYGGFGMPTVVVLGGKDHHVMFSTLSFSTSDTTEMRDSILAMLYVNTGIEEQTHITNSINFSILPNPTSDYITLDFNLKEYSTLRIDITDISGRQVAMLANQGHVGIFNKQFSIASLPNGIYIIKLQVNGKISSQKLVINH
jgi:thiol-disulfide isomerase/thioredoxin